MTGSAAEELAQRHADEAGFLWLLRDRAVVDPVHTLESLAFLDQRVEANLDGLRIAGDHGWEQACARVGDGAGGVFAAGVLAIGRGSAEDLALVLDPAAADADFARGLVSALGWAPFSEAKRALDALLAPEQPPATQVIGLAGYTIHREDPGEALGRALASPDVQLRARAYRAIGQLGRADLLPSVRDGVTDEDESIRFEAARAAVLCGDRAVAKVLWELASSGGRHASAACEMAVRTTSVDNSSKRLLQLAETPPSLRAAVSGAMALGAPRLVPWLLSLTSETSMARRAGYAFATITGIDWVQARATRSAPPDAPHRPSDDPADEDVSMHEDEALQWPDSKALEALWSARSSRFQPDVRSMLGQPMSRISLREVLRVATQPVRAMAAIELRLLEKEGAVQEVRAPGFRQR